MPSLPLLVSLLISGLREKNVQSTNVAENVKHAIEDDDGRPKDHRIDFSKPETDDSSPGQELSPGVGDYGAQRQKSFTGAVSRTSIKAVKKPYGVARHGLHGVRNFIFQSDKTLEDGYAPKYRWLPILSGLIVPFSILLEVPGLTEHWYVRTDGNKIVEYRPNPTILNVGLGISIASALLANIFLIIRFLERRIKSATISAICCLAIHDIINVTTLAIFGIAHRADDGFTYSQAYWVTFASTITSLFVTVTLLMDYARTPEFSKSGSGLTRKQRSLVIIVMILLAYLGFGALVYCFMLKQRFLDSLYFAVCSSLTIGFGDIAPNTPGAQVFSVFYNTIGILNTGLAIAIARETIVEAFEQSYRTRKHNLAMRRKIHREMHAKKHATKHGIWLAATKFTEYLPEGVDLPVSSKPPTPPRTPQTEKDEMEEKLDTTGSTDSVVEMAAGKEELYDGPTYADRLEEKEKRETKKQPKLERIDTTASNKSKATPARSSASTKSTPSPGEMVERHRAEAAKQVDKVDQNLVSGFDDEEKEYIQFRQDMIKEEEKEFKAKLWVSWGLFIVFWVLGGVIFMFSENWSYGTAIYFCFTAFSTIGYGDITPKTGPGRVCFIAWSLLGVGAMTIFISVLSEAYQSRYSTVMHNGLFDKAIRSYQNKTHSNKISSEPDTPNYEREGMSLPDKRNALDETKVEIAALPPKIIAQAKIFHSHLQYVLTHNSQEKPPPGLQRVLDELMDEEAMSEDLRKEVLQDGDARRTLFMMSFERTLKRMVENTERISKLLDQRDTLEGELIPQGDDDDWNENEEEQRLEEEARRRAESTDEEDDTPPMIRRNRPNTSKKSSSNWLKLRAGILTPRLLSHNSSRRRPYTHDSGSQSEPQFLEQVEEDQNEPGDTEQTSSNARKGKGRPPLRQGSRPSNVRFADDPYDEPERPRCKEEQPVRRIDGYDAAS